MNCIWGINFRSGKLEWREKIQRYLSASSETYATFTRLPVLKGFLILSTCNRIELYLTTDAPQKAREEVESLIMGKSSLNLKKCVYFLEGEEAVRHCFSVAAGMDSMIPGEPEILGQMKSAYQTALEKKAMDSSLIRLFEKAFQAAKEIRTKTPITRGTVSLASVALELAEKATGPLAQKTILLLGAGKTGETLIRHFIKRGCRQILVANRTASRLQKLSKKYSLQAVPFDRWSSALQKADAVFTAIHTNKPILTAVRLKKLLQQRNGKPLCFIDLAVPRNIDPDAGSIQGVSLFNIDNLKEIGERNRRERTKLFDDVRKRIDRKVSCFIRQNQTQGLAAILPHLHSFIHRLVHDEAQAALTAEAKKAFDAAISRFERNLTHLLIRKLKNSPGHVAFCHWIAFLQNLFHDDPIQPQTLGMEKPNEMEVIDLLNFRLKGRLSSLAPQAALAQTFRITPLSCPFQEVVCPMASASYPPNALKGKSRTSPTSFNVPPTTFKSETGNPTAPCPIIFNDSPISA